MNVQNTAVSRQGHDDLNEAIAELDANKKRWAQTTVEQRIDILEKTKDRLLEVSDDWATTAAAKKQTPDGSTLVGEEWLSGPYTVMAACNAFMATLSGMDGKTFLDDLPVRRIGNSQIAARVLPHSIWDHLLLSGISAEIWMQPGLGEQDLRANTAASYDIPAEDREGSVSLVLGAGNIAAIAPLDCFHKLFIEHSTVILKMNPVNDYLSTFLEKALEPIISFGALRIVKGGADVGAYLCEHPDIESIHITGAGTSHDAIVWGTGEEAQRNRQTNTPKNTRPVTSELGAVCPTIVVPGPWTKADIAFQAEQITTQKLHNSGFNCVACQMLILPRQWGQRDQLLARLKSTMSKAPAHGLYYPGAKDRIMEFAKRYPHTDDSVGTNANSCCSVVEHGHADDRTYAEATEVFAPVLSINNIDGADAETFLRTAIEYCNESLHGTLGANIIIHPKTKRQMRDRWDEIVGELKYGCIAVNAWTGLGFLSPQTPWGAFPGHTLTDVQSGIGFVHNTYMFDKPERTILEAPIRPFPRNLLHGSFTLLPRPPWFVTNKKGDVLGRLLTRFQHKPSFLKLPRIFLNALLG